MSKGVNRYLQEVGHESKSGKSVIVESKNGIKYYIKKNQLINKNSTLKDKQDIKKITKPICTDEDSHSYMMYWNKKNAIREEYPTWVKMTREQCREYYSRIWDLMQNDEDWKRWRWETRTLAEREEDIWWVEQKEKESKYNGMYDI